MFLNTNIPTMDIALTSTAWEAFLPSIQGGEVYRKRIEHFSELHQPFTSAKDIRDKLLLYYNNQFNLRDEDNDRIYSGSTIRGWHSIFKKWMRYLGYGELDTEMPILLDRLKFFEKQQKIAKARAFTKENLVALYHFPDTEETILLKAYAVIAVSFAARGCESFAFQWQDLKKIETGYIVSYRHEKTVGPVGNFDEQIISGKNSIN